MKTKPSDHDGHEPAARKPMIKPSHKGRLHANLDVPQGKPIPTAKLAAAKKNAGPSLKKQIQFAQNAKSFNHSGAKSPKPYAFA